MTSSPFTTHRHTHISAQLHQQSLAALTNISSITQNTPWYQLMTWSKQNKRWRVLSSNRQHITRLPGTWRTTAFLSPKWPVDNIFVLRGVVTSLCLDTVSARMGVGHLLLPAQLPGTHWVMICVIQRLALAVSDVCLKLGCFQSTSTYSALEVSHFMRYVNSQLTYLLAINSVA